jgi:hypothetical protein
MALTNLMVYRENGTRKQDVLTSALAGVSFLTLLECFRNKNRKTKCIPLYFQEEKLL